ncbi:hypothetical protein [Alienimonas sp. DA493]|uniref:hypothetical protein n=1 Tax=Alienimonas sp. DA493 TaxID=3373605 RepID=UPI003754221E
MTLPPPTRPARFRPRRDRRGLVLASCFALLSTTAIAGEDESAFGPDASPAVEGYRTQRVRGWTVHFSEALLADQPEAVAKALPLIDEQLARVVRALPKEPLAAVRRVPVWLSPPYDGFRPTAEYHPNVDWLIRNGRRKELARSVELTNVGIFPREHERMPMLMLHEFAHAYHDQTLGFDDPRVIQAYDAAKRGGGYDAVERGDGRVERAYAITNHKEYFAESTEAYFGRNDFYPFDRDELRRHDPRMHDLLVQLWSAETDDAEPADPR